MIVVTGAAGFIGSCLIQDLNSKGLHNIIAVDDFSRLDKKANYSTKIISQFIERSNFIQWLSKNAESVKFIFHIGARTNTTEKSIAIFNELNVSFSKSIWSLCTLYQIPLVYASSAATYGLGELGYEDKHSTIPQLKPLNPYGDSKQSFDCWVLEQNEMPPFWAGLKFFNVYGPNEYHKGRMASVIFHTFHQIKEKGEMRLFRSHNPKYGNGEQLRDFIYVKDVVAVCLFLMDKKPSNGIYNLGSGKARTFYDLASLTFQAVGLATKIDFIDTPEDIRSTYQYFTEANMSKLVGVGYQTPFHSLEEGVSDYVKNYLLKEVIY
jgi:ADP-L-glycero-D-manno-heptose 6-epimerase